MGELLDSCINFESRLSILEENSIENTQEIYRSIANINTDLRKMNQLDHDSARAEGRVATLLDTVKKFNETREKKEYDLEKEMKKLKGRLELLSAVPPPPPQVLKTLQVHPSPSLAQPPVAGGYSSAPQPPLYYAGQPVMPALPTASQVYPPGPIAQITPVPPTVIPASAYHVPLTNYPLATAPVNIQYPKVVSPHLTPITAQPPTTSPSLETKWDPTVIQEDQYSMLVGHEGRTINMIRKDSGATITIKEKTDKPPIKYYEVHYFGTDDQVKKAKELVKEVLEPFQKDSIKNVSSDEDTSEESKKSEGRTFHFGVQVECDDPTLRNCRCKIHDQISKTVILEHVELTTSEFGKLVIENVEKSLELPAKSFSLIKAVLYKTSFLSCEFKITLDIPEVSRLQKKFKEVCQNILSSSDNLKFPVLQEPTPVTNHKLYLTFIQSFSADKTKSLKYHLSKSNISSKYAPLFTLPYMR